MRGTRIPRLLAVKNYLNNYFAMYKRWRVPVYASTSHSLPTCSSGLFKKLFCHAQTSDALPYTHCSRIPRLLPVRNYLNNYFAMYKCWRVAVYAWNSHSLPTCGWGLFKKLFCYAQTSDALPYTRGTCIPRLRGVRNYLNNYFAMFTRLTRSRIRVYLACFAYLGLGII